LDAPLGKSVGEDSIERQTTISGQWPGKQKLTLWASARKWWRARQMPRAASSTPQHSNRKEKTNE